MSMLLTTPGLALLTGFGCVVYFFYRWLLCKPIPGIPFNQNAAYTLLGDIPELFRSISKHRGLVPWTVSQFERHKSPIVQAWIAPFGKPWVLISDFKETQDILLRRSKEFDRSKTTTDLFVGVVPDFHIIMPTDDKWKAHRNLLRDSMTPAFLNQVAASQIYASTTNLIKFWSVKADIAREHLFWAYEDIANTLLDSISAVSFGLDVEKGVVVSNIQELSQAASSKQCVCDDGVMIFKTLSRPPTYQALVDLLGFVEGALKAFHPGIYWWIVKKTPGFRRVYKIKEEMIRTELEKGLERSKQGDITERCTLDNLLQRELQAAKKADRAPDYNSRAVYDELLGFLLAGYETTTVTMNWGVKYLAQNQSIQGTLRSHLREAYKDAFAEGRNPTIDEIIKSHIPYLDATIEEINRCATIVSIVVRTALADTTILGYHIPKGTDVGMASVGPDFLEPSLPIAEERRSDSSRTAKHQYGSWDPVGINAFNPERWLKTDENGKEIFDATAGPMMAFSLGPRGCFGKRLAYLQLRILIVMILWNFELGEIQGELGNFEAWEKFSRQPVHCYLKLKKIEE